MRKMELQLPLVPNVRPDEGSYALGPSSQTIPSLGRSFFSMTAKSGPGRGALVQLAEYCALHIT